MKKSILIIGGGFGLSWSIARLFSKEGMDVSIASRNTEKYGNLDSEIKLNLYNCDASIIEDVNNFNEKEKKILINLNNEGFKILSLINWYERYLHRYPTEIISSVNIIRVLLINKDSATSKRIKRISEFTLSLLLLFITSPIILLFSIG